MRSLVLIILAAGLAAPAPAPGQTYQPWQDPDTPARPAPAGEDPGVRGLVERLNALIEEAEKARAADPRFLDDLRDLARGYAAPRRRTLFDDDFQDADFARNPAWTVTAGRFWVESGWGLRSAVEAARPAADAAAEDRKLTGKEAAAAIFGQILSQAIDPEGRARGAGDGGGDSGGAAAVQAAFALANAFDIDFTLSSWTAEGRLEIGPYRGRPGGAGRASGYVLAYTPGGGLELLRVSSRGAAVLAAGPGGLALEDKKTHRIRWTRDAGGGMRVSVDGREVLSAADRGFRRAFDGLRIVNLGGDYIIGRITVTGTDPG